MLRIKCSLLSYKTIYKGSHTASVIDAIWHKCIKLYTVYLYTCRIKNSVINSWSRFGCLRIMEMPKIVNW